MSNWKMRHEGSSQFIDGLTPQQIVTGVVEGQWETTDEVMGPNDTVWRSLETHPHFAETMADYEPPAPPPKPDETRLDMNPLIDVALVLLIFFVLTTTYQEMRKKLPPFDVGRNSEQLNGPVDLRQFTIRVVVSQESGQPVIRVQDEVVDVNDLEAKFKYWKEKNGLQKLSVEMDKTAPWGIFVAIQDAAAGARISETLRIERDESSE
jgi:biopolymer transport protein ExbD